MPIVNAWTSSKFQAISILILSKVFCFSIKFSFRNWSYIMWEVHHANQMLESCCRSESLIHFCLPRDEHFVISIFKLGASRLRKFKPMQIPLKSLS